MKTSEITAVKLFYLKGLVDMVGSDTLSIFDSFIRTNFDEEVLYYYNEILDENTNNNLVKSINKIHSNNHITNKAYPLMKPPFFCIDSSKYNDEIKFYNWQYISDENINLTNNDDNRKRYIKSFMNDLEKLSQVYSPSKFDIFMKKYGSFIAWEMEGNHVSVYHKMKTDISILEILSVNSEGMIIGADLSGIQDFIYTISSKSALKTLRARSFYLECFMEHIIDKILDEFNLTRYNLIYSGGGGFYIISPYFYEKESYITTLYTQINRNLYELFNGVLYLALDSVSFSIDDYINNTENTLTSSFARLSERLDIQKKRKYDFMLDKLFQLRNPNYIQCSVCSTEIIKIVTNSEYFDEDTCWLCNRFANIGKSLKDYSNKYLQLNERNIDLNNKKNTIVIDIELTKHVPNTVKYYIINSFNLDDYAVGSNQLLLGNYNYEDELSDQTIDFDYFANKAVGEKLIGALRMDVDDLGTLFTSRLDKKYRSLEIYGAISEYLNLFFKYYLNLICKGIVYNQTSIIDSNPKERVVSIIYSGGDDLFIVGAWNDVIEIGFDIRNTFREFIGSDRLSVSGGFTLHKLKFPLYQIAKICEEAESKAKENEFNGRKKNSFSMFYSRDFEAQIRRVEEHRKINRLSYKDVSKSEISWFESDKVINLTKVLFQLNNKVSSRNINKLFNVVSMYRYEGQFYIPHLYRILQNIEKELRSNGTENIEQLLGPLRLLYEENLHTAINISKEDINIFHIPLMWSQYLNR